MVEHGDDSKFITRLIFRHFRCVRTQVPYLANEPHQGKYARHKLAHELDLKSGVLEFALKFGGRISTTVVRGLIKIAPECSVCRYSQKDTTSRRKPLKEGGEDSAIVGNMLKNIEDAKQINGFAEWQGPYVGLDQLCVRAKLGMFQSIKPQLHSNNS